MFWIEYGGDSQPGYHREPFDTQAQCLEAGAAMAKEKMGINGAYTVHMYYCVQGVIVVKPK